MTGGRAVFDAVGDRGDRGHGGSPISSVSFAGLAIMSASGRGITAAF